MSKYVVLAERSGGWHVLNNSVEARSDHSAIRAVVGDQTEGARFVAVPARSFRPVTVKVETKTALKFS